MGNRPRLVDTYFGMITDMGYKIRLSDKGGGFCLVRLEGLDKAVSRSMPPSIYEPTNTSTIKLQHVRDRYLLLTHAICDDLSRPDPRSEFNVRLETVDQLVLEIQVSIKAHKEAGDVGCRIIHCGSGFMYTNIGLFLSSHLKPILRSYGHLLKDTRDVLNTTQDVTVSSRSILLALDITYVYLSGDLNTLACDGGSLFEGELKALIIRCVIFLLDAQYVHAFDEGASCYKLVRGSGMGINCSGDVANVSFLRQREVNGPLTREWT